MRYWLMKSEPEAFSIDDLANRERQIEPWDGVRNYQARNFMREMALGDQAFFYHSNTKNPGIVGLMEIVRTAYPDDTQFDPEDMHYDARSKPENPRWDRVDVHFLERFPRVIELKELKEIPEMADCPLVKKGNRLSVMPIQAHEFDLIMRLIK